MSLVARTPSRRKGPRPGRRVPWPPHHDPARQGAYAQAATLARRMTGAQARAVEAARIQYHLRRLADRAQAETLGLAGRTIPTGDLVRDTPPGRRRIAAALAKLELAQGIGRGASASG